MKCVSAKTPAAFVNNGNPKSCKKRIRNKTNEEISYCQTTIQQFGRRMKGRFLVKGNKDKSIPKKCREGEENVDCLQRN